MIVRLVFAYLVLLLASVCPAHADDVSDAEAAFQSGKKLMDAGQTAAGCAEFERSQRIDASVGTLLNLGDCYEKLGKVASAMASFERAASDATDPRRQTYATERVLELSKRVCRLELRAADASPKDLHVTRNGEDITGLLGSAIPTDPGRYVLEMTASGYRGWSKTVEIKEEGKTTRVRLPALEPIPEPTKPPTPTTEMVTVDTKPASKRRVIALGVGGVGLAVIATGLAFGGIAQSKLSESEDHCDTANRCDQKGFDLVQDAKSSANVSTGLVVVGGAALVVGSILWLTAPKNPSSLSQATLTPVLSPNQFGIAFTGGF